ncbi:hypothetical protein TRFO_36322 [Tritrichomonas foetus]|uniref:phosphomevalonate kinase n=1 Tax=Tritrichomonas foetus TaxID=1144522 RepID=A0A1J4JIW5_9EUKA|nr:hypothetical protein TRFO_36322 [Tritrichomonas foetus]|eukprot:OHS97493.1 hypothetical protein TRFO_36322 [Tritrichomonas foetus]
MIQTGIGNSKCLVLGGYLVLDHSNTALVLSLSPRVQCTGTLTNESFNNIIHVETLPHKLSFDLKPSDWKNPQEFLGKYERFILSSFHVFFSTFPLPKNQLFLSIVGDSQFYTENGKTGLGSSSATTVSIIQCLFKLLQPTLADLDTLVFKYAAVSHSLAQGNVGSCFDISCSVWGSQIFRRPSPNFISIEKINEQWDNEHISYQLPNHLHCLLLSTPFGGSSTANLVRSFNAKAQEDPELYEELKNSVISAAEILKNGIPEEIRKSFAVVKKKLRELSIKWEIDVLPTPVYEIASKVEEIDGVITSIIPGAGGYDSIAVITQRPTIDFSELGLTVIASSC